jgi:hypothetical protein
MIALCSEHYMLGVAKKSCRVQYLGSVSRFTNHTYGYTQATYNTLSFPLTAITLLLLRLLKLYHKMSIQQCCLLLQECRLLLQVNLFQDLRFQES